MWVENNGGERGALRSKRVDLKDMVVVVVGCRRRMEENYFFWLIVFDERSDASVGGVWRCFCF